MKAHKFVAEHGIEEAKRVLEGAPDWAVFWISRDQYHGHIISFPNMTGHYSIKLSELKQVVESVELIKKLGGLIAAKSALTVLEFETGAYPEKIKQAIADYELVESYKQVKVEVGFGIALQSNQSIGAKCEVLDMVDVSPRCEVINETH